MRPWVAAMHGDEIAALAGLRELDTGVVDVCVLAHPARRRQGFARSAVAAAVARKGDDVVLYQTLLDNHSAMGLAASLGFERYALKLAVRLRAP
jgi:hypothetical protein